MQKNVRSEAEQDRITAGVPFVEALARRVAASMSHAIDLGDLVQDGMIGMIDASHRFDEKRGIKFETFAERRVRGAMIDALRRNAWPRGIRRMRRELKAAREKLRLETGCEPSLSDLAKHMGADEKRLGRTIVRINTIESTSPLATSESIDSANLPPVLIPTAPTAPDKACEHNEVRGHVRDAIASLPWRERKVIGLYYYGEVTMKRIGAEIGVNESRVSQLHARAIQRLRKLLGPGLAAEQLGSVFGSLKSTRTPKMNMAQATLPTSNTRSSRNSNDGTGVRGGVVLSYTEAPNCRPAGHVKKISHEGVKTEAVA